MAHPPELKQKALQLRKQGLLVKVIAAELGVPKPTVTRWTNPKLEQRERARAKRLKFSQGRSCPTCKRRMANNATRCKRCALAQRTSTRRWTREAIIEAIQDWAEKHGHAPTYAEWQRSGRGHPAVKSITDGPSPPFKSWSEAIVAAGFTPRQHRSGKRMSTQERRDLRRKRREDKLKQALKGEHNAESGGA